MLADTIEARRVRIRHNAATPEDRSWARIVRRQGVDAGLFSGLPPVSPYVCDCRCRCHSSSALTATGEQPGSCGLAMNLETLDCERGCRSAHILASECQLDETRGGAHV